MLSSRNQTSPACHQNKPSPGTQDLRGAEGMSEGQHEAGRWAEPRAQAQALGKRSPSRTVPGKGWLLPVPWVKHCLMKGQ